MLCLYVQAPFAAFRIFSAGSFRPTADFITPSAAYGLLLNIAGIEMRFNDGKKVMTLIKNDDSLPKFKLALGAKLTEQHKSKESDKDRRNRSFPLQHSIFQQLHNYPVGSSGKERAETTKGNKYNIVPVRRAFLSDIRAYLCVKDNPDFEQQIVDGLQGKNEQRYGLPFMGDNNFLLDRIDQVDSPEETFWFVPIEEEKDGSGLRDRITRLTIRIDRSDMSRTESSLFAPIDEPVKDIPDKAWIEVGY